MKKIRVQSFILAVVVFLSCIAVVPPVKVQAVGEWNTVFFKQRYIDHWQGCTVCTLQLMMQNSGTLKTEWQLPAGIQQSSYYGKGDAYDKFNQQCTDNIANGIGTNISEAIRSNRGYGTNHVSDAVRPANMQALANKVCADGVTWTFVTDGGTLEGDTSKTGSSYVIGLGTRDFHSMQKDEVVAAMKLFWNAGYWVAIGFTYSSGNNGLGPGPTGYTSDHWVMLAGVDDNNFYINDPAYGCVGGFYNNSLWPTYDKVQHLAIYKCSAISPLELSGGQRANITQKDQNTLTSMGLGSLNANWSDAALLNSCRLQEINYENLFSGASVQNMTQDDLEVLESWRDNVEAEKFSLIGTIRFIVVLVGILITIWGILIYLAFWFDHINSFIYLDALHLLTLGQLHICPPNEKPTFSLGKDVKDKTVSHRQILFICGTAVLFGVMLISGVFYTIVAKFVNLIQSFLR